MMNPDQRIYTIKSRLTAAFSPTVLDVQDDSADHVGHAGSAGGAGHYTVIMDADTFESLSRIAAHRAIMSILSDMIPQDIHALRIRLVSTRRA